MERMRLTSEPGILVFLVLWKERNSHVFDKVSMQAIDLTSWITTIGQ
jgi:hypothetical protein